MSTSWYNWGLEYKVTHSLTRYSSTGSTNATHTIDTQRATIHNTNPIESHPDNAESTSNKNEHDCKSPEYWPIWAIWDWSDHWCSKTRATSILEQLSGENWRCFWNRQVRLSGEYVLRKWLRQLCATLCNLEVGWFSISPQNE